MPAVTTSRTSTTEHTFTSHDGTTNITVGLTRKNGKPSLLLTVHRSGSYGSYASAYLEADNALILATILEEFAAELEAK